MSLLLDSQALTPWACRPSARSARGAFIRPSTMLLYWLSRAEHRADICSRELGWLMSGPPRAEKAAVERGEVAPTASNTVRIFMASFLCNPQTRAHGDRAVPDCAPLRD